MKTVDAIKRRVRKPAATPSEPAKTPRLMRCVIGFAGDNGAVAPRVGTTWPENHPYVLRCPWAFLPADLPDYAGDDARRQYELSEVMKGQAIADETERRGKPREAPRSDRAILPLENQVICIKHAGAFGSSTPIRMKDGEPLGINVGEVADNRWKLVRRNPERFVKVLPEGLDVADALVCIADQHITQLSADGSIARRVYRGQLVSKEDPLTLIHEHLFQAVQVGLPAGSHQLVVIAGKENIVLDSGRLVGREAADAPPRYSF